MLISFFVVNTIGVQRVSSKREVDVSIIFRQKKRSVRNAVIDKFHSLDNSVFSMPTLIPFFKGSNEVVM
jgi:hypothetical protein